MIDEIDRMIARSRCNAVYVGKVILFVQATSFALYETSINFVPGQVCVIYPLEDDIMGIGLMLLHSFFIFLCSLSAPVEEKRLVMEVNTFSFVCKSIYQ